MKREGAFLQWPGVLQLPSTAHRTSMSHLFGAIQSASEEASRNTCQLTSLKLSPCLKLKKKGKCYLNLNKSHVVKTSASKPFHMKARIHVSFSTASGQSLSLTKCIFPSKCQGFFTKMLKKASHSIFTQSDEHGHHFKNNSM